VRACARRGSGADARAATHRTHPSAPAPQARFKGSAAALEANLAKIRAHNADVTQTWKMGVNAVRGGCPPSLSLRARRRAAPPPRLRAAAAATPPPQFAALTADEFKSSVIGTGYSPARVNPSVVGMSRDDDALDILLHSSVPVSALPASLDWREKGVVTPVKDQGGCGGCWSFSAAETTESAVAIASGKLLVFSEQELLACTQNPNNCGGTGGCSGATQELAFQAYVNNSITLEKDYPYQAQTTTCDPKKIKPVANITGCALRAAKWRALAPRAAAPFTVSRSRPPRTQT